MTALENILKRDDIESRKRRESIDVCIEPYTEAQNDHAIEDFEGSIHISRVKNMVIEERYKEVVNVIGDALVVNMSKERVGNLCAECGLKVLGLMRKAQ
ncbi:hypothetical protein ACH5RR_029861 [Cinchona calisaya]|uniref:Uncharacterized protein n=1 Tax=Cinchona calisaya TaxID=153742 RepID=A0ABD2YWR1_9GENT